MGKVWGTYHRGVLVIPLTRGTNPCIGLAVSQDPRAPRVWGSSGTSIDRELRANFVSGLAV